jgi:predicted metal-binding protein
MKVGIIRCQEYSNKCAGYSCFPGMANRKGKFERYGQDLELVGFDSCGGCGRNTADRIVERARKLKDKGAVTVHLGNCLVNACPWIGLYETSIQEATGLEVVRGTH